MITDHIERVRADLGDGQAALVMSDAGRLYLTGFASSAGAVLLTAAQAYLLIDSRYFEKASRDVTSCEVILLTRLYEQLGKLTAELKIDTLFVETDRLCVDDLRNMRKGIPGVTVSEDDRFTKALTRARACKDEDELALMREAQRLTDEGFSYILGQIAAGRTEREIALDLEFYLRRRGSEGVAFDTIAVSGCNSSLPHGVPTDKKIERGDFITMDFGAAIGGYRADMTRTVAVGTVSEEQKKVYETVLAAQLAGLAAIRAGAVGCEVDAAARDLISGAGYGEYFGHALGHSVGIEIHEAPNCSPRSKAVLSTGTIMTVEPGIYLPGRFGVRIEDMVCVTENGCENMTHSPKELIVL